MKKATLSVMMTNYNHGHYLAEALQAISDQSYRPKEIIIFDDASTDNSVQIIEKYARKEPLIKFIRNERNMGVIYNVNKGLSLSTGDYFYSAAADDKILPGFFEHSMNLLSTYPQAALCSTLCQLEDQSGQEIMVLPFCVSIKTSSFICPEESLDLLYRNGSWMMGNACIYKRQALLDAGAFIPDLHAFCDGFIQMVLSLKHGACFIPKVLTIGRKTSECYSYSISSNWHISKDMWSNAARLMRTTYDDLFPIKFVDSWERERLYHGRLSAIKKFRREQIKLIKSMLHNNIVDRIYVSVIKVISIIEYYILNCYLLIRFGKDISPLMIRSLIFLHKRLVTKLMATLRLTQNAS